MKTLCRLSMLIPIFLLMLTLPAIADDNWDDIDRVAFKNGYAHAFMHLARAYYNENGECPSDYWLTREIKLHVQHPEMFGGKPLKIYRVDRSYGGVPEEMTPAEKDGYIFYYGGPSGVVSVEIFDSATGKHYSSIITDSKNMAQSAEAAEHHVYHMFEMFAKELEGGDPADLIEEYARDLAIAPNDEAKERLVNIFRRELRRFGRSVMGGDYDTEPYAYELGRLRAAINAEWQDGRDRRLLRSLTYGY